MGRLIDEWVGQWVDGRTDGWRDGRREGWMMDGEREGGDPMA